MRGRRRSMLMCRTTPQGAPQIASPTGSQRRWPASPPPDESLDPKRCKIRTIGVRPAMSRQPRRTTAKGRRFRMLPRLGSWVRIPSPAPVLFTKISYLNRVIQRLAAYNAGQRAQCKPVVSTKKVAASYPVCRHPYGSRRRLSLRRGDRRQYWSRRLDRVPGQAAVRRRQTWSGR